MPPSLLARSPVFFRDEGRIGLRTAPSARGLATVSYSAGISACGKGEQWQRALALLREMPEANLEPDAVSYGAATSACGKGEQWQRALALLKEMREVRLEPIVISTPPRGPVHPSPWERPPTSGLSLWGGRARGREELRQPSVTAHPERLTVREEEQPGASSHDQHQ